uniref:Small ribosomal subunit protein bS18m n=1 Tax=Erpetoichthys calabaricus TaxID=27687 RepID=A0A8C4X8H4_ERPCA
MRCRSHGTVPAAATVAIQQQIEQRGGKRKTICFPLCYRLRGDFGGATASPCGAFSPLLHNMSSRDVKWLSRSAKKGVLVSEPMKIENPYKEPPKKCTLCGIPVDYKNVQLLSQFISPHTGRIYGRHITGLCGKKQKEISKAIKKSHYMGFMPVVFKEPAFLKDPNICSIKHHE